MSGVPAAIKLTAAADSRQRTVLLVASCIFKAFRGFIDTFYNHESSFYRIINPLKPSGYYMYHHV
jgi:hypothetical protein